MAHACAKLMLMNDRSTKPEYIKQVLTDKLHVLTWKRNPDGVHSITLSLPGESGELILEDLSITDDDLSQLDPRLPSVIKHMAEQYNAYIQTDPLVLTYTSHWARPNYKLRYTPCSVEESKSMNVHTWFIHAFTYAEICDDKFAVFTTLYNTGVTPEGIEYAKSRTVTRLFDLDDWLHECIPGGTKILEALQSLELPESEWGPYLQKRYVENMSVKPSDSVLVSLPNDVAT